MGNAPRTPAPVSPGEAVRESLEESCRRGDIDRLREHVIPSLDMPGHPSVYEALRCAIEHKNIKAMSAILDALLSHQQREHARTAFQIALEFGDVKAMDYLRTARGIKPSDALEGLGLPPKRNQLATIQYLMQHGADVTGSSPATSRFPLLPLACSQPGQRETVKALLEAKANPTMSGAFKRHSNERLITTVPLAVAAECLSGQEGVEISRMLLNYGADPDRRVATMGGETPLRIAIRRYQVPLVMLLLERGASVKYASDDGNMWKLPVQYLMRTGNSTLLQGLVAAGMPVPDDWARQLRHNSELQLQSISHRQVDDVVRKGKEVFDTYITGLRGQLMSCCGLMRPVANLVATYAIVYFPPPEELPGSAYLRQRRSN